MTRDSAPGTDGVTWHAADPGVPVDTLVTDQLFEAPAISDDQINWHGTMVVDPHTGYVFTAIACSKPGRSAAATSHAV